MSSSNPWLALGLCPNSELLSNSALIEDLIDSASKVMKKHLHPDKTGGNSEAFIAAQDARESLNDHFVRNNAAAVLIDSVEGGLRLREQLESQRDLSARAVAELNLIKMSQTKERAALNEMGKIIEEKNAKIREYDTEIKAARRETEQTSRAVKTVVQKQQALIESHSRVVKSEKAKINERVETLTNAVTQSAELIKNAYEELKTLRRVRLELDETLRRIRTGIIDETRLAVPYYILTESIFLSITAAIFGAAFVSNNMSYIFLAGLVWFVLLAIMISSGADMMRRLNRLSWQQTQVVYTSSDVMSQSSDETRSEPSKNESVDEKIKTDS